jgi:hypothetical protein
VAQRTHWLRLSRNGAGCDTRYSLAGTAVTAPTLYGPEISSLGLAVIDQACLSPMRMMSALRIPPGIDCATYITGSANTSAASIPKALSAEPPPLPSSRSSPLTAFEVSSAAGVDAAEPDAVESDAAVTLSSSDPP